MKSLVDPALHLSRPYRKSILIALLVATFSGGLALSVVNINRGNYPLAVLELTMVFYSAFVFVMVRRAQLVDRWILAFILPFLVAMMFDAWHRFAPKPLSYPRRG